MRDKFRFIFFIAAAPLQFVRIAPAQQSVVVGCPMRTETRVVHGKSMEPLIKNGKTVKVLYGYYACRPAKRGDIAVIDYSGFVSDPIIKMIKGVPGDRFSLRPKRHGSEWNILVNGKILKNSRRIPYLISNEKHRMLASYAASFKGIIPGNAYLILGDRPEGSMDSTELGLIGGASLIGKVEVSRPRERHPRTAVPERCCRGRPRKPVRGVLTAAVSGPTL